MELLLILLACITANLLTLWIVSAVGPVRGLLKPLIRRTALDLASDDNTVDAIGQLTKKLKDKGWL